MKHVETVTAAAKTLSLLDSEGRLVKIDSMTIIDFVVELEERTRLEIPPSKMTNDSFKTIESVAELLTLLEE
jgi:acyl carrier protein